MFADYRPVIVISAFLLIGLLAVLGARLNPDRELSDLNEPDIDITVEPATPVDAEAPLEADVEAEFTAEAADDAMTDATPEATLEVTAEATPEPGS